MKGLAVVVLRFSHPDAKRWKFPLNFRIGKTEIPFGLMMTTAILFLMAIMNLFTKKAATLTGGLFTIVFFALFTYSERKYASQRAASKIEATPDPGDPFRETSRERFRFQVKNDLSPRSMDIARGCTVVALEDPNDLRALRKVLADDVTAQHDVVVMCVHQASARDSEDGQGKLVAERVVGDQETDVLSEAVFSAEKAGKPLKLLALCGEDALGTLLAAAASLGASDLWLASSHGGRPEQQETDLQDSWKSITGDKQELHVSLVDDADGEPKQLCLAA